MPTKRVTSLLVPGTSTTHTTSKNKNYARTSTTSRGTKTCCAGPAAPPQLFSVTINSDMLGVYVREDKPHGFHVARVLQNSYWYSQQCQGKIQEGDWIVEIDSVSLRHASMEKFKKYLALKKDCVKTLTVQRGAGCSTRDGNGHGDSDANEECLFAVNVESKSTSKKTLDTTSAGPTHKFLDNMSFEEAIADLESLSMDVLPPMSQLPTEYRTLRKLKREQDASSCEGKEILDTGTISDSARNERVSFGKAIGDVESLSTEIVHRSAPHPKIIARDPSSSSSPSRRDDHSGNIQRKPKRNTFASTSTSTSESVSNNKINSKNTPPRLDREQNTTSSNDDNTHRKPKMNTSASTTASVSNIKINSKNAPPRLDREQKNTSSGDGSIQRKRKRNASADASASASASASTSNNSNIKNTPPSLDREQKKTSSNDGNSHRKQKRNSSASAFASTSNNNDTNSKNIPPSLDREQKKTSSDDDRDIPKVLSQLQMLRDLTDGDSQFNFEYTEEDLLQCLRQCGYNANAAGDMLINGTFSRADRDNNASHSHSNTNEKSNCTTIESSFAALERNSSMRSNSGHGSKPTGIQSTNKRRHGDTTTRSTRGLMGESNNDVEDDSLAPGMLLCTRNTGGFCTSRKGSVRYNESIKIYASPYPSPSQSSGTCTTQVRQFKKREPNFVRFKGCEIEGTICPKLANFLGPLLRLSNNGNQIVKVIGKGLIAMDESHVGMQVPVELSIYIVQPQAFFDIFDARDEQQKVNDMNNYWTGGGPNFGLSLMARIAFKLLKWANDGILLDGSPTFNTNVIANVNENGRTSVNISLNSEVQCSSGPVLVSDTIARMCKPLNGERCNGHHPMWERRFLWDKSNGANGNTVYAFYVNEVLDIASACVPTSKQPPSAFIQTKPIRKCNARDILEEFALFSSSDSGHTHGNGDDAPTPRTVLFVVPSTFVEKLQKEMDDSDMYCSVSFVDTSKQQNQLSPSEDISNFDILIITYEMILRTYYSKNEHEILHCKHFRKVILFESKFIHFQRNDTLEILPLITPVKNRKVEKDCSGSDSDDDSIVITRWRTRKAKREQDKSNCTSNVTLDTTSDPTCKENKSFEEAIVDLESLSMDVLPPMSQLPTEYKHTRHKEQNRKQWAYRQQWNVLKAARSSKLANA